MKKQKTGIKERLRINRFGVLVTQQTSNNQCKQTSHTHYEYQVSAVCDKKLDGEGFVINHTEIDRVVQDAFHREMSSCEVILIRMVDSVQDLMVSRQVKVYEIYGKLMPILPIPTKEFAYMEMTRDLNNV